MLLIAALVVAVLGRIVSIVYLSMRMRPRAIKERVPQAYAGAKIQ